MICYKCFSPKWMKKYQQICRLFRWTYLVPTCSDIWRFIFCWTKNKSPNIWTSGNSLLGSTIKARYYNLHFTNWPSLLLSLLINILFCSTLPYLSQGSVFFCENYLRGVQFLAVRQTIDLWLLAWKIQYTHFYN